MIVIMRRASRLQGTPMPRSSPQVPPRGARNIEWREVLSCINEIPTDKKVILFCNTGLSAQAAFALRVAGRDNVVLLQIGLDGWKKDAAYKP